MATNTFYDISMITREFLRTLKNNCILANHVNRDYDDTFAIKGAKIGNVINVRKPARYTVSDGNALDIQNYTEQYVPVTLDKHKHVDIAIDQIDWTLSFDDVSKRFIEPAAEQLANQIDQDGFQLFKDVPSIVGAPGTTPNALLTYLQAKAKLANNGAPLSDLAYIISPTAEITIVDALKGLFQDSTEISKQYKKGKMGTTAGGEWFMDQNVAAFTSGTWTTGSTPVVAAGADQSGSTLNTSGWQASTAILKDGDVFTIAGVYQVNPKNRQSTGVLQQFVSTGDVSSDAGGLAAIAIYPAITASGQYQTVNSNAVAASALVVFGTQNIVGAQNLLLHPDAFCLATADIYQPTAGVESFRASDKDTGLSILCTKQFDITNFREVMRMDILYGWTTIYPELACRIAGGVL